MYLDEIDVNSPEADALARKILTALVDAWAWDHQIKATVEIEKIGKNEREGETNGMHRNLPHERDTAERAV